jgi:hypothetical protein
VRSIDTKESHNSMARNVAELSGMCKGQQVICCPNRWHEQEVDFVASKPAQSKQYQVSILCIAAVDG